MATNDLDEVDLLRRELTGDERAADAYFSIDPGFVHHRLIESVLGERGTAAISSQIEDLPTDLPDWMRETQIGHVYARTVLKFCEIHDVPTLGEVARERRGWGGARAGGSRANA